MVVGIKDAAKLVIISIIVCCAVFVCSLFVNFSLDLGMIEELVALEAERLMYDAFVSTSLFVCSITGGCLLATSVVTLLFYIKHYIDTHKKELGILKAIGYSNFKVAKNFWVFGLSVFTGAAAGVMGARILMPAFYEMQNKDNILPEITMHMHAEILIFFVVLPTVIFALLAIIYAFLKLKRPALAMLRDVTEITSKVKKPKKTKEGDKPFIKALRSDTLRSGKTLVFFIIFASLCFSAMTQMSVSVKDLSSEMMGAVMLIIGVVLACTTLFLAITTVIKGNTKTVAMMRVFGYSQQECTKAILGGYRPLSYIGFVIGTGYQYLLIQLMSEIVLKDLEGYAEVSFDVPVMLISLAAFILFYEIVMKIYSEKIKKISVKEIMIE